MVVLSSAPPLGEMVLQIGQLASGIPPGIPTWVQSIVRLEGMGLATCAGMVALATNSSKAAKAAMKGSPLDICDSGFCKRFLLSKGILSSYDSAFKQFWASCFEAPSWLL